MLFLPKGPVSKDKYIYLSISAQYNASGRETPMKSPADPDRLRRRVERLSAQLGRLGCVLVGTIRPRWLPARGKANCPLGPYYQWTFKDRGKTVTVNLAPSQVKPFQQAIDRNRKAEELLAEMRALSRVYLDATTEGVKRRKPKPC